MEGEENTVNPFGVSYELFRVYYIFVSCIDRKAGIVYTVFIAISKVSSTEELHLGCVEQTGGYTGDDRARVLGNAVFGIPLPRDPCHPP